MPAPSNSRPKKHPLPISERVDTPFIHHIHLVDRCRWIVFDQMIQRDWSFEDLARALDCDLSRVYKWLIGGDDFELREFAVIMFVLDLDFHFGLVRRPEGCDYRPVPARA